MLSYSDYAYAWLHAAEFWCDYMDRFHPAYGGWARVFRHARTGRW